MDALLGPIGEPYLDALCTKWQIERYGWDGGDYVNQPLDLQSFAWRMNLTEPQAVDLDEKMVATFRSAIEAHFEWLHWVEFAGQRIGAEAEDWWIRNFGRA